MASPVPPYMEPTLEKSAQFIMSLVKPDLSTPMIGDADRDDLTTRRCDTSLYEGMNLTFDPYDLNEMRAYFRTWYEETGREDFRFMATAGKEGTPPAQRNYKYIPAGYLCYAQQAGSGGSYFHVHASSSSVVRSARTPTTTRAMWRFTPGARTS